MNLGAYMARRIRFLGDSPFREHGQVVAEIPKSGGLNRNLE